MGGLVTTGPVRGYIVLQKLLESIGSTVRSKNSLVDTMTKVLSHLYLYLPCGGAELGLGSGNICTWDVFI